MNMSQELRSLNAMDNNVSRFPMTVRKHRANKRGVRVVECSVSGRLLIFDETATLVGDEGNLVRIQVFPMPDGNEGPARRLCEMYLSVEDLAKALGAVRIGEKHED